MMNWNKLPFDLQLFAEPEAGAGNLLNTTTTMSAEMRSFYEKRLIDQAEPRLVHDQFADYYPVPVGGGKTIEFRKYDSLPKATTPLTEGVTPDGQALNVSVVKSDLHQYGGWTPLTDVLQGDLQRGDRGGEPLGPDHGLQADPQAVLPGGGPAGRHERRHPGRQLCGHHPPLRRLRPQDQQGVDRGAQVRRPRGHVEVHKYADPEAMYRGEIGKLGNIRFIETSEAKIWKDDTCPANGSGRYAVFGTLVLGAHAYGVTELEGGGLEHIVKQLGYGDDPLNQRASVGWKGMRAAERLVEQYMVRIESLSSYSASAAAN